MTARLTSVSSFRVHLLTVTDPTGAVYGSEVCTSRELAERRLPRMLRNIRGLHPEIADLLTGQITPTTLLVHDGAHALSDRMRYSPIQALDAFDRLAEDVQDWIDEVKK